VRNLLFNLEGLTQVDSSACSILFRTLKTRLKHWPAFAVPRFLRKSLSRPKFVNCDWRSLTLIGISILTLEKTSDYTPFRQFDDIAKNLPLRSQYQHQDH
jgi:hypothetical protein